MALVLRACNVIFLVALLLVGRQTGRVKMEPTRDKRALLSFLSQTPHSHRVRWNTSDSVCNWVGVGCDSKGSYVTRLRLPGTALLGTIPPDTIGRLSHLRVLSLRSNHLSGKIPVDFANLTFLRCLYLQKNKLTGEFPSSLTGLSRLVRLDLSSNHFTGSIPFAINDLVHLTALLLQGNAFSGNLLSISAPLEEFNVSNNNLNSSIPETLSRFPDSSFVGNLNLCGEPLPPCDSFPPAPAPSPVGVSLPTPRREKSKNLSKRGVLFLALGCSLLLSLLIPVLFLFVRKQPRQQPRRSPSPVVVPSRASPLGEAGPSASKDDTDRESVEGDMNKLTFLEGGVFAFDLEDLLTASAEVLGKGTVGTSYKALLEGGTTVVVKRLKEVVLKKEEFNTQIAFLGNIKHHNIAALRAFYFSKEEKLLINDYMPAGSLAAWLHGKGPTSKSSFFPSDHNDAYFVAMLMLMQTQFRPRN